MQLVTKGGNIRLARSVGIHATFAICRDKATGTRGGKTYFLCQGRENVLLVPRAGKHTSCVKGGKTCHLLQALENVLLVSSKNDGSLFINAAIEHVVLVI